jgi:hypothetical protein
MDGVKDSGASVSVKGKVLDLVVLGLLLIILILQGISST